MHIRLVFLSPFSVNLDNIRIVYKQERKSIVVHKLLKKNAISIVFPLFKRDYRIYP